MIDTDGDWLDDKLRLTRRFEYGQAAMRSHVILVVCGENGNGMADVTLFSCWGLKESISVMLCSE